MSNRIIRDMIMMMIIITTLGQETGYRAFFDYAGRQHLTEGPEAKWADVTPGAKTCDYLGREIEVRIARLYEVDDDDEHFRPVRKAPGVWDLASDIQHHPNFFM